MTAQELKIGDTIKRQGIQFTVRKINNDMYKNGTPCIAVECSVKGSNKIDSYFNFKLTTKIK